MFIEIENKLINIDNINYIETKTNHDSSTHIITARLARS